MMRPLLILFLALLPSAANAQLINIGIPSHIEVGADPKTLEQIKKLNEIAKRLSDQVANLPPELQAILKEHTPILIPRGWYEKQTKQIEDLTTTNAALLEIIETLKGDRYNRFQGIYHWAGKQCGLKVLDKKTGRLELHFPSGFPWGLGDLILDATYDPAIGRVEIYRDKQVVRIAWLNYKPGGGHTLVFDENQWWTFGAVK